MIAERPRATRRWLAGAAVAAALVLPPPTEPVRAQASGQPRAQAAEQLLAASRVLVIAHRGDSKAYPENTLPAFESAAQAGADLVELDYHHSADGVPVVIHDETLDRTTDARRIFGGQDIPVASKRLAELQTLDAGSWFDPKFAGTRLPTLEQALDAVQPRSRTLIERKAGDAATCVDLIKRNGLVREVVLQSFDWAFLAEAKRLAPRLVVVALGTDELTSPRLDEIAAIGAAGVGWNDKFVGPEVIAAVHARRLKLWVWTVDDLDRARQLAAAGADGIITNTPAAVRRALAGVARPAP